MNLTTLVSAFVFGLGLVVGAAIVALVVGASVGVDVFRSLEAYPLSRLIAPTVGAAATLGGLASTVFFLTAQQRASNVGQYGLSELYRFSRYAPILVATVVAVGSGTLANASLSWGASDTWYRTFVVIAVVALLYLLTYLLALGMSLLALHDPVSVAVRFARDVKPTDAREWGLIEFTLRPGDEPVARFVRYRLNFGLRDPLMTIHELILGANPQRFGQLLGVLAERVSHTWWLSWAMQYPDPSRWIGEHGIRRMSARMPLQRRTRVSTRRMMLRLQLALLILHYLRRIHTNAGVTGVPAEQRRRISQFVLARLVCVLAQGHPRMSLWGGEVSRVIELSLAAWNHITLDARESVSSPADRLREPTEAMLTAIACLEINGFTRLAHVAVDVLGAAQHHAHHLRVEEAPLWPEFSEVYREFADRLSRPAALPVFTSDPWSDLPQSEIPEDLPEHS